MRKNNTLGRRTRRKTSVFVALVCASLGVFIDSNVQAQVTGNKGVSDVAPIEAASGKADGATSTASAATKGESGDAKANAKREIASRAQVANDRVLETRVVFYPTELAWGDAAYFATVERNIVDAPQKIYAPFDYELGKYWDLGAIKATVDGIPGEYVYANERATGKGTKSERSGAFVRRSDSLRMRETAEIAPGEERFRVRTAFEFPPLEDANDPFWTAVRDRLNVEGRVVLQLSVEFDRFESWTNRRRDVFETEVVLNKRVISETETLDGWGDGMSRGSKENLISLNGERYDLGAFGRVGNRKPGDPTNPTTLEGWRDLENAFEKGTLRDEITFVRLQLEYYAASQDKETSAALETLLVWLAARPEAQRAVLAASVVSTSAFFKGKELEKKYRALVDAVEKGADRFGPNYERFRKEEAPLGDAKSQICEPFPPRPEPFAVETRNVVWPQEAFFGDVVYFAAIDRNVTSTLGGAWRAPDWGTLKRHFVGVVEVEAEGIDAKHLFFHELWPLDTIGGQPSDPQTLLPPGAERTRAPLALEFPPLEDWNDVFWTAVREKLATEKRVVLRFTLTCRRDDGQWETIASEIVLKPRPEKEMELVASWRDATPSDLLPERVGQHKFKVTPRPYNDTGVTRSGFEEIALDGSGENFSPWLFVRVGNRKPCDPNNPTTLEGWRKLENEFAPSTLRDEITFVRLQLEYYAASLGAETEAASKALVAWLASRPEAQRVVLATSVFSKASQFAKTRLNEKYVALVEAIRREPEIARLLEKRELIWTPPTNEKSAD